MIPLTSLDAALILAETEEMPLHNLGLLFFEGGGLSDEAFFQAMRALLARRIGFAPTFRRRLVQGRTRIGDLHFIEDPRFDLNTHLHRQKLGGDAGRAEIEAFLGEYAATLLDREKPLWEATVLEGLASGEHAMVVKIHHAAMDGLEVARFAGRLFAPEDSAAAPGEKWRPEREPGPVKLGLATARSLVRRPAVVARAALDVAVAYGRAREVKEGSPEPARGPRLEVPRTPWAGALGRLRAATYADVSLHDLRIVGETYGVTVNDVVLAAATAALRRWLLDHDALPELPLVANVPIAVKRGEGEEAGNAVSLLRVPLPTRFEDPVERLARIGARTSRGKRAHRKRGSNAYRRLTDLALSAVPPRLVTRAVGAYSRHGGADLHPALWNVVISNIAGPREALHCGSARLTKIHPFGPVQHGSGLNLTVMSAGDRLGLGVVACREKVPDLGGIGRVFVEEVAALRRRAEGPGPLSPT